jgi:hypothetical protein
MGVTMRRIGSHANGKWGRVSRGYGMKVTGYGEEQRLPIAIPPRAPITNSLHPITAARAAAFALPRAGATRCFAAYG